MPFLMPMGFIGSPASAGASGTASVGTLVAAFLDSDSDTGPNDTQTTYSGLAFGSATGNRLLIVVVHLGGNDDAVTTPASVTIGGVAGTLVVTRNEDEAGVSIWQALVPTGTTGSVVVTYGGGNLNNKAIGLWSIQTNTQAATNSGGSTSGGSIAATVPTNGYAIVGYSADRNTGVAFSGTASNFTEDYEFDLAGGSGTTKSNVFIGGHATASATIDVTPSASPTDGEVLVYASWGP